MRFSLIRAAMLASVLCVFVARPGSAQSQGEITNVTTNATTSLPPMPPTPLVENLSITTLQNLNDSVFFDAYLFSSGPLEFDVTVDGPGTYYIGNGRIFNVTDNFGPGFGFTGLEGSLQNAPTGSVIGAVSYDDHFSSVTLINPTTVTFNGPPGIPVEESAGFYVAVDITGSGPQTFDFVLTPLTVPEPSSLVLGLISAVAGLGYAACRRRRKA
jgi:hypothetical protein